MTPEQIEKWWKTACENDNVGTVTKFARLVAQDTWERAAKIPERRRDARFEEHGTTEHDTNASYYTGRAAEMYDALDEEDEDVAAEIRAAAAQEPKS